MDERATLMMLAEEYLAAAQANLAAGRRHAAFESARHAAELAGKACLLDAKGNYPKAHDIGRDLAEAGRVPPDLAPEALDRFLAQYVRGRYGADEITPAAAAEALRMAHHMVAFARR
jgi:HEPN domain-containing protein